jgi:hypothetical protein
LFGLSGAQISSAADTQSAHKHTALYTEIPVDIAVKVLRMDQIYASCLNAGQNHNPKDSQ